MAEDTIGVGGTRPIARACGAHFTLANTSARALGDLFNLALHEQNDSLAEAALDRLLAQATTPAVRNNTYLFGVRSYLYFGRLAAAQALLTQIDALGPTAREVQLAAHERMLDFYGNVGDTIHVRQEAEREIVQGRKRVAHEPRYGYVLDGYRALMNLTGLQQSAALPALAVQAQRDLQQFTSADQEGLLPRDRGDWGAFPVDTLISRLAPEWYSMLRYGGGIPASRLQADYWFPAPGHAANDTIFPVPGKVNLICVGGFPTDFWEAVFNHTPLYSGYQQAVHLQHWLARYGADGLVITLVRLIDGYPYVDLDVDGLSRYRFYQTPAEEARMWRWYDQVYHQLPLTLAVQVKRTTQWLPQPDGRRLSVSSPQYQQYVDAMTPYFNQGARATTENGSCTVISRDGRILHNDPGGWGPGSGGSGDIDVMLRWLFTGPGAVVSSPVGSPTRRADGSPSASANSASTPSLYPQLGKSQ